MLKTVISLLLYLKRYTYCSLFRYCKKQAKKPRFTEICESRFFLTSCWVLRKRCRIKSMLILTCEFFMFSSAHVFNISLNILCIIIYLNFWVQFYTVKQGTDLNPIFTSYLGIGFSRIVQIYDDLLKFIGVFFYWHFLFFYTCSL